MLDIALLRSAFKAVATLQPIDTLLTMQAERPGLRWM